MSVQFKYSKAVQPGDLAALKEAPLTKEELADMPRIIRKFEAMGLIRYKASIPTPSHTKKDEV